MSRLGVFVSVVETLAGCYEGWHPAFFCPLEYNRDMTITPIPSPIPQDVRVFLIGCDTCGKYIETHEDDTLAGGWREVELRGWVGLFHACSDDCENTLKEKVGMAP